MSSRDNPTAKGDSQGDTYEAAVLEFLNKELAAAQQPQNQRDQSDELDALVADLLNQVITESDQQAGSPQLELATPDSATHVLMPEQREAYPADSDLLANLNRGLSQTYSEEDLWDGQTSEVQPSVAAGQPAIESQPSAELAEYLPQMKPEAGYGRSYAVPAEEKTADRRSSPHGDIFFRPMPAAKRKLPMAAIAAVCLLAVIAGGVYTFMNSSGSPSKGAAATAENHASMAAEEGRAAVVPLQAGTKGVESHKAQPQTAKKSEASEPPKAAPTAEVRKPSAPEKDAHAVAAKQPVNNSRENAVPPPAAVVPPEARVEAGEMVASDRSAASLQVAVSAPAIEKESPPTLIANGSAVNGAAAKILLQPITSAPIRIEDSTPNSKPPVAAAVQPKVLIPPAPISQPNPTYPEIALRSRASGAVVLDLQIDEKGAVTKATPVSGPAIFHNAAAAAALKWRYQPASIDGTNVPSKARVTINFNLNR